MLQGERLTLKPLSEDDVDHIMTWVNNPDIIGNIATLSDKEFTREDESAYVWRMQASTNEKVFSIWEGERYIGQAGIHQIYSRAKNGRFAVVIASKDNMGKGYGSETIKLLLDYAFSPEGLGLHKVWLIVFEGNKRSRQIYERIGFVQEGILRDEYYHEDRYHNIVRMSVLASEW